MHERKNRRRVVMTGSPVLALALLAGTGGCASSRGGGGDSGSGPEAITGRYIAVVCDADMVGTAFHDNLLGDKPAGVEDSLTVVTLPIATAPDADASRWQTTVAQVPVSNSVMGPPVSLAVSADGNRAFVAEARGPAGPGATTIDDLAPGRRLTAVDLTNPASPSVLGTIDVGQSPMSVDVHPEQTFVAVATGNPGQQIALVKVDAYGAMSEPMSWPLLGFDDQNLKPTCVAWHPSGRYLAVTIASIDTVAFYEFSPDTGSGTPGFAPWGEPVKVGKFPFSGKFTPDGKHFITTDLGWGPDVEGFLTGAPAGRLSVIRLSDTPTAVTEASEIDNSRVVHTVSDTATVGVSPESLAISPGGEFIVTANLVRSHLPETDPRATAGGSLSLLRFDARRGRLTPLTEVPVAALPEGVAFDAAGRHVIVSQFRTFSAEASDGELAFFELSGAGAGATLRRVNLFVGVGRGPHGVLIVR